MKVRRLELEAYQMARIRVEFQMARLSIHTHIRRIKAVHYRQPQMVVERENPRIKVDMQSLWDNTGLKSISALVEENAAKAIVSAGQAAKEMENAGDLTAALALKGANPVAEIARERMLRARRAEASGEAADPTVSVSAFPGSLSIDWKLHDISIVWDEYQQPVIKLDPKASINIELAQKPHISFKVVEVMIPPARGRKVDRKA